MSLRSLERGGILWCGGSVASGKAWATIHRCFSVAGAPGEVSLTVCGPGLGVRGGCIPV